MMELHSGLETGMMATTVIVVLCLATWLLFRIDHKGEKSLFSKIMAPYDREIEKPTSVLEVSPFFHEDSTETFLKTPGQSPDALNPEDEHYSIRPAKGDPYETHSATTIELQDSKTIIQHKHVRSSSRQSWQKSAGMFAGKPSLGGILVVDDDPAIRKLNRFILENVGYDVLEAEDGQEAINVLSSGKTPMVVDLIITDLNMPKVDGFEAIASFQEEYPSIPVIVLTGIADPAVEASFKRQGVSDYLLKPVDARTLMASVANAIAQEQFSWA